MRFYYNQGTPRDAETSGWEKWEVMLDAGGKIGAKNTNDDADGWDEDDRDWQWKIIELGTDDESSYDRYVFCDASHRLPNDRKQPSSSGNVCFRWIESRRNSKSE